MIRTIVASALCDAVNGAGSWECLKRNNGQTNWLHMADKVIRELAYREHMCVAMDELEALENKRD